MSEHIGIQTMVVGEASKSQPRTATVITKGQPGSKTLILYTASGIPQETWVGKLRKAYVNQIDSNRPNCHKLWIEDLIVHPLPFKTSIPSTEFRRPTYYKLWVDDLIVQPSPFNPSIAVTTLVSDFQLERLILALSSLLSTPDEGYPVPTDFAYRKAQAIVGGAYARLRMAAPNIYGAAPGPEISADDMGGVRVSWRSSRKKLRANFGANQDLKSYLYFEEGDLHGVERLNEGTLRERLRWLVIR